MSDRDRVLLGINSDPLTSRGAILWGSVEDFERRMDRFVEGGEVEEWTRLRVDVDAMFLGEAVGTIFVGALERDAMSSYRIVTSLGPPEVGDACRSSGLLVYSGTGSTGWPKNATCGETTAFPRTAKEGRYLSTELDKESCGNGRADRGRFAEGEELIVRSLHRREALVSLDSVRRVPFPRGSLARISVSPNPLRVLAL